uniref:RING-type E3 ubiquitin transferase n=1 Tax=Mastacembelus armatus TaxID=205130 RepID=A0A7N9AVR6_9TELE
MVMDPPGGTDERQRQAERLQREEAYYHFINELSEEEYRLMRDSNLLGTPGEKKNSKTFCFVNTLIEIASVALGIESGADTSNGDSLLEWLNTFRRTGNATRSGQSGNQTWRAVSRTNPNSGEFRFSLEININHDQPDPGEHNETGDTAEMPVTESDSSPLTVRRRITTRRRRRSTTTLSVSPPARSAPVAPPTAAQRRGSTLHSFAAPFTVLNPPLDQTTPLQLQAISAEAEQGHDEVFASIDCPRVSPQSRPQDPVVENESRGNRTRSRGSVRRAASGSAVSSRSSRQRRSRSPLHRIPVASTTTPSNSGSESHVMGAGSPVVRRLPTIMLDLQVRRIRPGENRDRDSIASRTRSHARVAENTVTFESDSGGFRRTISRSERAGIRTYVSTIRIPLRRISETGLGEPNSTALRSILRQIMTGFGELSSLMETEVDSENAASIHTDTGGISSNTRPDSHLHTIEGAASHAGIGGVDQERLRLVGNEEDQGAVSRDTNNLVENGTLPILRLAHFLLSDEEDDEHPRGLTKEQIDNLSTRIYGQASLEGEMGRACSVCINEYAQGNKLRRLPCSHEFHIHCIDRWLSENNTCPICRQPILTVHHN